MGARAVQSSFLGLGGATQLAEALGVPRLEVPALAARRGRGAGGEPASIYDAV